MGQPFGARAKQFTGDLAFGKIVTIRVRDVDRYQRIVADIIVPDGKVLNHEIVKAGLAWWYRALCSIRCELRTEKPAFSRTGFLEVVPMWNPQFVSDDDQPFWILSPWGDPPLENMVK